MADVAHIFYDPPAEDYIDLGGGFLGLRRAYTMRNTGNLGDGFQNQPYGVFQTSDKIYSLAFAQENDWFIDADPESSFINDVTWEPAIAVYDKATKTFAFFKPNNAGASLTLPAEFTDIAHDSEHNGIYAVGREDINGDATWFFCFIDIETMEITSIHHATSDGRNAASLTVGNGKVRFELDSGGNHYEAWTTTDPLLQSGMTLEAPAITPTPDSSYNLNYTTTTSPTFFWGARIDALDGPGIVKITPPATFTDHDAIHGFSSLTFMGADTGLELTGISSLTIRYDADEDILLVVATSSTKTHPSDSNYKLHALVAIDPLLMQVLWVNQYYVRPGSTSGIIIANASTEPGYTWIRTLNSYPDSPGTELNFDNNRWRKIQVLTGEEIDVVNGMESDQWPDADPWIGSPFFWDHTRDTFYSPAMEDGQTDGTAPPRYIGFGLYDGYRGGMWDIAISVPFSDGPDMNPAHIILECLTNDDWGMGAPTFSVDLDAFHDCADVLWQERLGLSLQWTQQTEIENFIGEILNHIQATLFVHPETGLITLKLIRDDYDPSSLPILDRTNFTLSRFGRKLWGDTTNEIAVTWTNPDNEQEEVVTFQDLGNISIQGGIVSDSRNYYGVRSAGLAKKLAVRDLRAASAPLASGEGVADRSQWNIVPGDVRILNYPEYGVESMLIRIGSVDYGKPGDPGIKISFAEDVFGLPFAQYTELAPPSLWEPTGEDPSPIEWHLLHTLPFYFANAATDVTTAVYPEVLAGILAAQDGSDTNQFELMGTEVDPAGNETIGNLGTFPIAARGQLGVALSVAATSFITEANLGTISQGEGPTVGGFLLLGDEDEAEQEICLISDFSGGSYLLKRGVLDTVPKAWPIGTPIWFFTRDMRMADFEARTALDTVDYKILPRTSRGLLPVASAADIPLTLSDRPHLPSRPANVMVEGVGFGLVDGTTIAASSPAAGLEVTWSNRNRLTETTIVLGWTDAGVTPEVGQTTTITVMDDDHNILVTHTGLTGESFEVPISDFYVGSPSTLPSSGFIKVTSVRDDFESLQGYELEVQFIPSVTFDFTSVTFDSDLITLDHS